MPQIACLVGSAVFLGDDDLAKQAAVGWETNRICDPSNPVDASADVRWVR